MINNINKYNVANIFAQKIIYNSRRFCFSLYCDKGLIVAILFHLLLTSYKDSIASSIHTPFPNAYISSLSMCMR